MLVLKINCNLRHIKIVFMIFLKAILPENFGSKSRISFKEICLKSGIVGLTAGIMSTITSHFLYGIL